jgi:hypothetical protein
MNRGRVGEERGGKEMDRCPLTVVCFAKMKEECCTEIHVFEDLHMTSVGKGDSAGIVGCAFLQAFTPESVKAAFEATGVHLFNPGIITDKHMQPSLLTSTKASFPLAQISPVCAILKAVGSHPPILFELSPTTHKGLISGPSHSTPSPSHRHHDNNDYSEPKTLSKWVCMMYSELGSTASGSMLLSKTHITSAYKAAAPVIETAPLLPEPDWIHLDKNSDCSYQSQESLRKMNVSHTKSLCHSKDIICTYEIMGERTAVQLIIQNSHLHKLNQVLHSGEQKEE